MFSWNYFRGFEFQTYLTRHQMDLRSLVKNSCQSARRYPPKDVCWVQLGLTSIYLLRQGFWILIFCFCWASLGWKRLFCLGCWMACECEWCGLHVAQKYPKPRQLHPIRPYFSHTWLSTIISGVYVGLFLAHHLPPKISAGRVRYDDE